METRRYVMEVFRGQSVEIIARTEEPLDQDGWIALAEIGLEQIISQMGLLGNPELTEKEWEDLLKGDYRLV